MNITFSDLFSAFIQNWLLVITPLLAAITAQFIKIGLQQTKKRKFNWKHFLKFTYSGMPSGHTALMVSLTTIIGLVAGFTSAEFALAAIVSLVIVNDAIRLRGYLGQHGETINELVNDLKDDEVLDQRYPHLLENIGHTPAQVWAGAGLGVIVSILMYWLSISL